MPSRITAFFALALVSLASAQVRVGGQKQRLIQELIDARLMDSTI